MYILLNSSISQLGILSYQNTWANTQEYTHSDSSCSIITVLLLMEKTWRIKMYVDKCHKYIDEKTKAHTCQITGTKTKAYHICDLNRQLFTLFLKAEVKCKHLEEAFLDAHLPSV